MEDLTPKQIALRLEQLTELSVALGDGHDLDLLLERILLVAKRMTHADGGTLYRPTADGRALGFYLTLNDTLHIRRGGSGEATGIPPVPLFDADGERNLASVAAYAANQACSVNIEDVYNATEFNFSGMRQFDQQLPAQA